jgi:hypothetical protein
LSLEIDFLSGEDVTKELDRHTLLDALNEHFEGSTLQNDRIVTSNEKYDILVKSSLEIIVLKHGDNLVEELNLDYAFSDYCDWYDLICVWTDDLDFVYEDYAQGILDSLSNEPEEREMQLTSIFVEGESFWDRKEYVSFANYCEEYYDFEERSSY